MKSFALTKKELVSSAGLSLSALLKSTDSLRKSGSGDTIIKALSWTKTNSGLIVAKAKMSSASRRNKLFDTWITFMSDTNKSNITGKSKVQVQCSCEDYMFTWEYANAAHNAARIFYGNGEAPDDKNPGLHPGLCKHAYRLAREVLKTF